MFTHQDLTEVSIIHTQITDVIFVKVTNKQDNIVDVVVVKDLVYRVVGNVRHINVITLFIQHLHQHQAQHLLSHVTHLWYQPVLQLAINVTHMVVLVVKIVIRQTQQDLRQLRILVSQIL